MVLSTMQLISHVGVSFISSGRPPVIMDQGLVDGGLKEELRTLSGQELMHSLLLPMEDALAVRIGGARPTRLRKLLETQFPPLLPEGE